MQYKTFTLQKYLNFALPVFLFFVCTQILTAQRRFSAEGIVGMTASQIDGDRSAGFHKVGLQGGIGVSTRLKGKQSASVQMLFTQRGCRNQPQIYPLFNTTLNYVEVPIEWHYADWLVEGEGRDDDWYRARFSAGLSYARLISYKDKYEYGIYPVLSDLNSNSFCLVVGATLFTSRHLGITFRYNRALAPLYLNSSSSGKNFPTLFERFLAIQLNYRL